MKQLISIYLYILYHRRIYIIHLKGVNSKAFLSQVNISVKLVQIVVYS